jgi:hypothetical protein
MAAEGLAIQVKSGGAERDRTADLLNAIQALSHLSYSPILLKAYKAKPNRCQQIIEKEGPFPKNILLDTLICPFSSSSQNTPPPAHPITPLNSN